MEIKRCVHTHFIKAIKFGCVGEVDDINYHGSPSLSFKALMVDKTLREIGTEKDEFAPCSRGLDSDLDDTTTIRQLKERSRGKKRKFGDSAANPVEYKSHSSREIKSDSSLDSGSEDAIAWAQHRVRIFYERRQKRKLGGSEDESNNDGHIISLKSKNSKVSSSTTSFSNIKWEPNLVTEGSQQVGCDLAPLIHTKFEELEGPRKTSFDEEASYPADEVNNGIGFKKPMFSPEECRVCVTNMISYEHLDDFEPTAECVPSEKMNENLETLDELSCHEVLGEMSEQISSSGAQDLDIATDCTTECVGEFADNFKSGLSHGYDNSLSSSDLICSSSQDYITPLKIDDGSLIPTIITDKEHTVTRSSLDDITENGLNSGINISDELLKTNAESQPCPEKQIVACADISQPSERLLSTRKVISPSSQQRLCSAMNSADMFNGVNQYDGSESKEQLCEEESQNKARSARTYLLQANIDANHGRQDGQVNQRKVHRISSRPIYKKKPDSKSNLEGPRFSRIIPNLSTECSSIESCSERAIAFSQMQMQDMESLAFNLMAELESMKSIFEQKLLFEVYRNVSQKSNVEEVKSAVKSATKLEERARKRLSTMSRDCKRFCKIMKLTPNASTASDDVIPRQNRKIVFADEAGGELCHVKYFEDDAIPPASDCVKHQSDLV